jgi:hypothetical protein
VQLQVMGFRAFGLLKLKFHSSLVLLPTLPLKVYFELKKVETEVEKCDEIPFDPRPLHILLAERKVRFKLHRP